MSVSAPRGIRARILEEDAGDLTVAVPATQAARATPVAPAVTPFSVI